jgi:hypothetical protein
MLVDYSTRIIPRRAPELIAREAQRKPWRGWVPTTSLNHITVRGVELTSRYQQADELEAMRDMVMALGPATSLAVESIYCDSGAYSVAIWKWAWRDDVVDHIGRTLAFAARHYRGGHNGITLVMGGCPERRVDLVAGWVAP